MSPLEITLVCVLAAIAGYGLIRLYYKLDERREDRRRAASRLASVLAKMGLKRIPEILIAYSVGDYSGMVQQITECVRLFLSGEAAVLDEFDEVFERVLAAKLKTESGRALLAVKLSDAVRPDDPAVVKQAPKAKAA
jgi:hypothetical protein